MLLLNYVILNGGDQECCVAGFVECRELLFLKVTCRRCVHFKCFSQSVVTLLNALQKSPGVKWVAF